MNKRDLKDGMVVETREGNRYLVVGDILMNLNCKGFNLIEFYNDDLLCEDDSCFDIMIIYNKVNTLDEAKNEKDVYWEREWNTEMTISEIEKALGIKNLKIKI